MKKFLSFAVIVSALSVTFFSCGDDINTVADPHFTPDGHLVPDSNAPLAFRPEAPKKVKFYVEVSGSMNGFFRANKPTDFKTDVWQVVSCYSSLAPEIYTLTNDGSKGGSYSQSQFQTMMNTGAFESSASTRIPTMLQSIFDELDTEIGEVAVLISDMKYDPIGLAAPKVLLADYCTDVSKIIENQKKAVSLIGATSDYLDKAGVMVTDKSPYYYFLIGNETEVAFIRDGVSTMLQDNGHFIDNIESGFNYGAPTCSFDIPDNCIQMNGSDPTFVDFNTDSCTIKMKVNLEGYRWLVASEDHFRSAFKIESLYGSSLKVEKVSIDINNISNKKKKRTAMAIVEVKVFGMPMDSDVLKWTLELPDKDVSRFAPYFDGANNPNDYTKSFSVDDFIKGIFKGSVVNKSLAPNYILISKNR